MNSLKCLLRIKILHFIYFRVINLSSLSESQPLQKIYVKRKKNKFRILRIISDSIVTGFRVREASKRQKSSHES